MLFKNAISVHFLFAFCSLFHGTAFSYIKQVFTALFTVGTILAILR